MENISRDTTFGDFVTILTETSRLQGHGKFLWPLQEKLYICTMQLHTGAEHFENVIKGGIAKRGCS
jgi:hypothetical protein